jgi:hypothetical protein
VGVAHRTTSLSKRSPVKLPVQVHLGCRARAIHRCRSRCLARRDEFPSAHLRQRFIGQRAWDCLGFVGPSMLPLTTLAKLDVGVRDERRCVRIADRPSRKARFCGVAWPGGSGCRISKSRPRSCRLSDPEQSYLCPDLYERESICERSLSTSEGDCCMLERSNASQTWCACKDRHVHRTAVPI